MKRVEQMTESELREELMYARVALIAFNSADSTDAFENVGHFQTARTALENWKQTAHFRKEDEMRRGQR